MLLTQVGENSYNLTPNSFESWCLNTSFLFNKTTEVKAPPRQNKIWLKRFCVVLLMLSIVLGWVNDQVYMED